MRASTNILTIVLTASMVATATAAPKEKRTAPPARAAAPPREVHEHVIAVPRQERVITAPRQVHVITAPRRAHVVTAPRPERVEAPPRHAQHERTIVAPRQVHVLRELRRANAMFAPRKTRFALEPRESHRLVTMPHAAKRARLLAPVESPLMLSREVRAVRLHGHRVSRAAVRPSRHVSYIAGRVLGVNDRVVVIQPAAGGEVPVRITHIPVYRTVVTGQTVTIPVTYANSAYYAYQPNGVMPYIVNTAASPFYGVTMNPWDAQAYYDGNEGEDDNGYYQYFGRQQYPDCSQPYYGQNANQYYFTHQQYDAYCGTAGDPYGAYSYDNYGTYANYDPYYQIRDTAMVSGLIVGRSGSNLIVLTNDLQPAIINVGPAEQMGNTSGPLQVGRPIVAAGFYDSTNTLVATTVQ